MFNVKDYDFNNLKKYMLTNIDNINNNININNNNNNNDNIDNKISKNLIYVDYNKFKKKYNNNNKSKEDPFFWCFYNIFYNHNTFA